MNIFGKRRYIIGSIAQLLLIVIIFPIVLQIFSFFINFENLADKANSVVFSLIGSIPCFNTWVSMIIKYTQNINSEKIDVLAKLYSNNSLITSQVGILKTFFQAILAALCVKLTKSIHKIISINGANILSVFLGVLLSTILNYFLAKNNSVLGVLIWYGGLIIIMLVGMLFMFKSIFASLRTRRSAFLLDLIIGGISAVITSCYLTVMIFAVNGVYSSFDTILYNCLIMTIVEIINLVIGYILFLMYDLDRKKGILS